MNKPFAFNLNPNVKADGAKLFELPSFYRLYSYHELYIGMCVW